jgi:hypothetical protein
MNWNAPPISVLTFTVVVSHTLSCFERGTLVTTHMSEFNLTRSLLAMLERIERYGGTLLMLAVTASGGREYGKLSKLRGAGYVVKCDHPSVTEGAWPAEALAITEAGRAALARHRAELAEKKSRRQSRGKAR